MKANQQQQSLYDYMMANVRHIVFNDQGVKTLLDKVQSSDGGPVQGIGHTSAMLVRSVSGGLAQQGMEPPQDVVFGALRGTVSDLTEVAAAAKVIPDEQKTQVAQGALADAVNTFKSAKTPSAIGSKEFPGGSPQATQPMQPGQAAPAQPMGAQPSPQVGGIINQAMKAV